MRDLEKLYKAIQSPVITEKASVLTQNNNVFCFKVAVSVDKKTIKSAIEEIFKVSVVSVNTVKMKGKVKSFGKKRITGKRNDFKKAYIRLKEGQSIDVGSV